MKTLVKIPKKMAVLFNGCVLELEQDIYGKVELKTEKNKDWYKKYIVFDDTKLDAT